MKIMSDIAGVDIRAKYVEFTKIIEEFTEEKIQERYFRLLESAQAFIQEMGYQNHVVCNETMLMYAVLGYFSDISRLKAFHNINHINDSKILAYETTWLLKRRPLQIKDNIDSKYAFCNEQFVLSQIELWLKKDVSDDSTEAVVNEDLRFFYDMLFYHLKYRNYDPQTLELMLVSFMAGRKYQLILSAKLKT